MDHVNLDKLSKLSEGNYSAFLYDCDGTLADNMPAHTDTYVQTAKGYNLDMDPHIITELAGWPIADVVAELNKRYSSQIDPEEFRRKKADLYASKYIKAVRPIEYVVQHLKNHAGIVRIGVVSGGDRSAVEATLKVLGIFDLIDVTVCAGDTNFGKPYPDPFLKAAELLKVDPETCLVFEDGAPGVESAKAAGMDWIRIDELVKG